MYRIYSNVLERKRQLVGMPVFSNTERQFALWLWHRDWQVSWALMNQDSTMTTQPPALQLQSGLHNSPDSQEPKRGILQFSAGCSDKEPDRCGLGLIPGGALGDVKVSK